MSEDPPPLVVVVGPTASGKSALASLLAERMNGEVVSADSVQVYRYFDIGSGKPSEEERARAPHHLLDVADPLEPIEANVWARMAARTIDEIRGRGRRPIVCGGTFLWVRALLFGLAEAPPGDAAIRARHQQQAELEGRESLHKRLVQVDPESAARLHPNDFVRVSRALEVHEISGRPLSEIQKEHGFREPQYESTMLALDWAREEYEERLLVRTRQMMTGGFREEVRALLERGYEKARAMDAVGYRQVKEAELGSEEISDEELTEQVIRVTRVFARRQRTWLRDQPIKAVAPSVLQSEDELRQLTSEL